MRRRRPVPGRRGRGNTSIRSAAGQGRLPGDNTGARRRAADTHGVSSRGGQRLLRRAGNYGPARRPDQPPRGRAEKMRRSKGGGGRARRICSRPGTELRRWRIVRARGLGPIYQIARVRSGGFDLRPDAVADALAGRRQRARPLAAGENFGRGVEGGIVADGLGKKGTGRAVGGRGLSGLDNLCRHGGAEQIIQKLMRQTLPAALAEDHGAVAIEGKALGGVDEGEVRGGGHCLGGGGGPELRGENVTRDELVTGLRVKVGAYVGLLRDGLAPGTV